MIEIGKDTDLSKIKSWFTQNLAGKTIIHPKISKINIYNASFNETRHWIPKNYMCILYKLKDLLETSTTNGIIGKDSNKHTKIPNLKGFIYLYNKIKVDSQILSLRFNIMVLQNEQKYYMFNFVANEDCILDPIMFPKGNLSEGSNTISSNIITDTNNAVKIGDIFWLGDSIQITVVDIVPDIQKINNKLDEWLKGV